MQPWLHRLSHADRCSRPRAAAPPGPGG